MNGELIRAYKEYYYNQMSQYEYRYCTAFPLVTKEKTTSGVYADRALSPREGRNFIHKKLLYYIKHKILVRDRHNRTRKGIPFYAYYVISKEVKDIHFHVHIILNFHEHYLEYVQNYIEFFIESKLLRLETKEDAKRMINYMLRKGNLLIDSDNEYLIPTGYNLGVDKRHFGF